MFACITENLGVSDDQILAYSLTLLLKGGALSPHSFWIYIMPPWGLVIV